MDYISTTKKEKEEILSSIGALSFKDLIGNIPQDAFLADHSFNLIKNGVSELETFKHLKNLASKNQTAEEFPCFLGAGAYHHFIPAVIPALISRGEFLTAYTPYQPEASQGTLQATFEYQTMIADLYGMDLANASLYDGGSALAEATFLALRETNRKKVLVSKAVHPEYRKVLQTYCQGFEIETIDLEDGATSHKKLIDRIDEETACVLIQSPNFFGVLEELQVLEPIIHEKGALFIVSANPISLGVLASPGECGADVAVGEGQALGISLGYGGPYLGLFSCKEKYARKIPGRICGMTHDLDGKRGFVLTLQTREQHIRREKATSNICTNEALMALAATIYLSVLGPQGLKELAEINFSLAHMAAHKISQLPGFSLAFAKPFFNEFVVRSKTDPEKIKKALWDNKIIGGLPLGTFYPDMSDCTLFCATEMNSPEQIDALIKTLEKI